MTIDISECKKYWACRKSCEPIDEFVSIRDIKMLIGYVEQLQVKLGKARKTSIECLEQTAKYEVENEKLEQALRGKDTEKAGE